MDTQLASAYEDVLAQFDFNRFSGVVQGLSNIFLPSAPSQTPLKLLVIGQETKGWLGSLDVALGDDLPGYVRRSMARHREMLAQVPRKSKFGQFHKRASKKLRCAREEIGWANLFSVSYRRKSPVRSPAFMAISELSRHLLEAQLQILQPQNILFVTGPGYDCHIKAWFGADMAESQVIVARRLWRFRLGSAICYRTNHPRCPQGREYHERVLDDIAAFG